MPEKVILRFENVSFAYENEYVVLDEASFGVRENSKITLMGQNGAGKSSLFKLVTGELKPQKGQIFFERGARIAVGLQVMAPENLPKTVRDFFAGAFAVWGDVPYDLDRHIANVLEAVNLHAPLDKIISDFSGGQQARLLLAYALIQDPDILLLDEPTNNLDANGVAELTAFLIMYPKTVLVISHDADFLNSFTDGVLHLDVYTHKVDTYDGNYLDVVEEIAARIERERMKNAQLLKEIQDRKDKINFFAHKGGKMRKLAAKLGDQVEEAEENMVDVKRDDKTIRNFTIPAQPYSDDIVTLGSAKIIRNHEPHRVELGLKLRRGGKLLIEGPNGIGKSTLLRALFNGKDDGLTIASDIRIGYYRQDFSGLDYQQTAYKSLEGVMDVPDNERLRMIAAQFLLTGDLLLNTVGALSEGQKGLLCFARFVLQAPGLLILDEPTNHINFRHLPIIAEAINNYQGALIMVSHAPDFVEKITFTQVLNLGKYLKD